MDLHHPEPDDPQDSSTHCPVSDSPTSEHKLNTNWVVSHFLLMPESADAAGNPQWGFGTQVERFAYWRYCLARYPWLLYWWLTKVLGGLFDVKWTYGSGPPGIIGEQHRQNIRASCELHFLYLLDTVYLFQLEQDVNGTRDPRFDADNNVASQLLIPPCFVC
jgi:hypothetical protein